MHDFVIYDDGPTVIRIAAENIEELIGKFYHNVSNKRIVWGSVVVNKEYAATTNGPCYI